MSQPPYPPPPRPGSQWKPPPPPGNNPFSRPPGAAEGAGTAPGRAGSSDPLGWGPPAGRASDPGGFGYHSQFAPGGQHDPTQSFGAPPPASVSIESFAEPPSRSNWIIAAVVGTIIAVMIVAALAVRNNSNTPGGPTPTPTPSVTPSVVPSAVAAGRALPFESRLDNATGYWEITDSAWTSDGLRLSVLLRLDSGSMSWTFFAMDATDTRVYEAEPTGGSQDLSSGVLKETESRTGEVFFPVPRHDMLIVLTDSSQRQIATLSIRA